MSTTANSATSASALWVDGERFVSDGSSGHAVAFDSDRERNTAPGPMEMLLRSLCACSATDLVIMLKKSRQAVERLEVAAEGERAAEPPRVYTRIHVTYRVRGRNLDRAAAERAVKLSQSKYCSVFVTLEGKATITHELVLEETGAAAGPAV